MGQLDFKSWEELDHLIEEAHGTALVFPELEKVHFDAAKGLGLFEADKITLMIQDKYLGNEQVYACTEARGFKYDVVVYVCLTPEELEEARIAKAQAEKDGLSTGYGYFPETQHSCQIYDTPIPGMQRLRTQDATLTALDKIMDDLTNNVNKFREALEGTDEEIDREMEDHFNEWAEEEEKKEGGWFDV